MYRSRRCAPFAPSTIALRRATAALVAGAICCHPGNAGATATYSITLQGASQSSASPLRRSYWTATPGVAPTIINEEAAAAPGEVGAYARLDTSWPFEIQAGVSGSAGARAATDDFVIAGPPNATTVQGAMRFRTRIRLDRGGGLAGSDLHRARASLHVTAAQLQADGSCWLGNLDMGSDGVLGGHSPPLLELSFTLPGTFPVGQPFAVSMDFEAEDRTFGNATVSPGFTETDGLEMGITLGDENGQAMELPPGYTVNAADWNVVANVTGIAGGPGIDPTGPRLAPPVPNPSAGNALLRFSLPRSGDVSLVVTDLQGRVIRRMVAGWMSAGSHDEIWDGRRDSGERVAPGVYFAVVGFEHRTLMRRLAIVR
jgi:hypothetical protein